MRAACVEQPREWKRHRPETTPLYALVRDHLDPFARFAEERYAAPLPRYVLKAFRAYLKCGLLEHGFLRVRCDACDTDRLVAFSCKQRGPCPSCAARVMCNAAAHLTDRVFPNVPIRQWVLSLPFDLRIAAARDPRLLAACDRIFVTEIFRWMRRDLGLPRARGGAVTFVQRFGGSLNLHVHYHVLVFDGVFERIGRGSPAFVPARAPTAIDLSRVVERVARAVRRWISRHRGIAAAEDADALAGCTKLAVQRGLFAELDARIDDDHLDAPRGAGRKSASFDGFDLHAAVRVGADDDVARERLARYCARPAFALERLSILPDGRIAYALKNPRRGASHRVLTPVELLARIAALIPPPRHPFLRYHGVLAPASKWRALIVPRPRTPSSDTNGCHDAETTRSNTPARRRPTPNATVEASTTNRTTTIASSLHPASSSREPSASPRDLTPAHLARLDRGVLVATSPRLDWASLLRRTFAFDVLTCPKCHAHTRVLVAITAPAAIRRILKHLHEPPARAPPSGAREPMFEDVDDLDEPR